MWVLLQVFTIPDSVPCYRFLNVCVLSLYMTILSSTIPSWVNSDQRGMNNTATLWSSEENLLVHCWIHTIVKIHCEKLNRQSDRCMLNFKRKKRYLYATCNLWTAINSVFRAINAHEVYLLKITLVMMWTCMHNIIENSTMPPYTLSLGIAARSETFNEV